MGQWLQEWAPVLSAIATILTMFVWVFYFHFAIFTYRSQRRSRVIVDQTEDHSLNTKFLVVNLSELPVYVTCLMVVVKTADGEQARRINTYSHFMSSEDDDTPQTMESELQHGTLDPAGLLMLGDSNRLLSWLLDADGDEAVGMSRSERLRQVVSEIDHFDIRVIAMAGNQDKPIASRRRFLIDCSEDGVSIYPQFGQTQHFNSWRDRGRVDEWVEQCIYCPLDPGR